MKARTWAAKVMALGVIAGSAAVCGAPPAAGGVHGDATPILNVDARPDVRGIDVVGLSGAVSKVTVTLNLVSHRSPADMDVMLIGPDDQRVVLISDACGGGEFLNSVITFDSSAPVLRYNGRCTSGTFAPTDYADGIGDQWPLGSPTSHTLDAFDGTNPNGRWTLVIVDDLAGAPTHVRGGWSLDIDAPAIPGGVAAPGGPDSSGVGSYYPYELARFGWGGRIADLDVTLPGLYHSHPSDIDLLLVGPNGSSVMLLSDACGGGSVSERRLSDADITFDDEARNDAPETAACGGGHYRPTNYYRERLPSPAPPGPYESSLAAFDGISPNGEWRFYFVDDATGDAGFLAEPPRLEMTLTHG